MDSLVDSLGIRFLFLLTLLFALGAPAQASARDILFSSEVPIIQSQQLTRDLALPLNLIDDNEDMKKIMGINDLSDDTLKEWLGERVGYIIGETEDPSKHLVKLQDYVYQNAEIFPNFENPTPVPSPTPKQTKLTPKAEQPLPKVTIVMANVGSAFYYFGKENKILLGYEFNSPQKQVTVAIPSPRAGFIQIGQGLFEIQLNSQNPVSLANSYFRLGTIFHEAHHSDGNGKSLGFPHAVCPQGSDYYNLNACDRNSNGPYTVGAYFMKQAALTCLQNNTCSKDEYERLAMAATDSYGRVISENFWDSTPEGL